jgi:hypothetical protein
MNEITLNTYIMLAVVGCMLGSGVFIEVLVRKWGGNTLLTREAKRQE